MLLVAVQQIPYIIGSRIDFKLRDTKMMQQTLLNSVTIQGIGLHSGRNVSMTLSPAKVGSGVVFVRSDLKVGQNEIEALYDNVVDTRLCT